jgi:hypothetical protein
MRYRPECLSIPTLHHLLVVGHHAGVESSLSRPLLPNPICTGLPAELHIGRSLTSEHYWLFEYTRGREPVASERPDRWPSRCVRKFAILCRSELLCVKTSHYDVPRLSIWNGCSDLDPILAL